MKKISKMSELAWVIYLLLCSLGVVLCTKANFGLSMLAAPPYILHVVLSKYWPFFTQGMSEYLFQAFVMAIICIIVKKFRVRYLLSLTTSVIFGFIIDLWILILGGNGAYAQLWQRIVAFIVGEGLIGFAVAFGFNTYLPAQIGELVVTEISSTYNFKLHKVKLVADLTYLVVAIVLSLTLTHAFTGIGVGTVVITLINSPLINGSGKLIGKFFEFDAAFPSLKKLLKN